MQPGTKLSVEKWRQATNQNVTMVEVADVHAGVAKVRLHLMSGAQPLVRMPVEELEEYV